MLIWYTVNSILIFILTEYSFIMVLTGPLV